MARFIEVEHPDLEKTAKVPAASLKHVWGPRGWKKVTKRTKKASAK